MQNPKNSGDKGFEHSRSFCQRFFDFQLTLVYSVFIESFHYLFEMRSSCFELNTICIHKETEIRIREAFGNQALVVAAVEDVEEVVEIPHTSTLQSS